MKKVLIIDDDEDLLYGLTALLTNKGYHIKTVTEGEEASTATLRFSPDVILLDVHLKDMNGIAICKQLKSNQKTKDIPILMISADADIREMLHDCPADACMEKPLTLITLYHQLEQLTA